MKYSILETLGVEIDNIDGAIINKIASNNQNGKVAGYLKNLDIVPALNSITIKTGLLIIQGIRIRVDEDNIYTLAGIPDVETNYQLVVAVYRIPSLNRITAEFIIRTPTVLTQNSLFDSSMPVHEKRTYEIELATFTHDTSGNITNFVLTCPTIDSQVLDVLISGRSVVDQTGKAIIPVARIPYEKGLMSTETPTKGGIQINNSGNLVLYPASDYAFQYDYHVAVTCDIVGKAVRLGLTSKADSYTEDEKKQIQSLFGITEILENLQNQINELKK